MRWVPHRGQGMEDYRLPGSRVNPKNCARVMRSFQKIRSRVQDICVFGHLSLDGKNTGTSLDRGDRTEPSTINWIGSQHAIGLLTARDSTLGPKTQTVRHRLASMSPFRNLEVYRARFSELIS